MSGCPPLPALWFASPRNPTGCSPGQFDGAPPPPPPERKSWSESRRSQLPFRPPDQHSAGNISLHSSFDISYFVVMISWELIDKQKLCCIKSGIKDDFFFLLSERKPQINIAAHLSHTRLTSFTASCGAIK